jgi:hypothetical protein
MKKLILCCFLLFVLNKACGQYPGTNIRGQVLATNQWGNQVPFASAKVDLYYFNQSSNQWQFMGTCYSDGFGFFSFPNVPVDNYVIWINGVKNYGIQVGYIDYRYYQFQDLGPFFF